jgi:cysteine desulfurase
MHFITSVIEHSSVLECFRELEEAGAKVDYAPVKENGVINPEVIAKFLKPETVLVSIGFANNEIGTIQPLRKIAGKIREHNGTPNKKIKTLFHTDASQAPLYLDCTASRIDVDLMTLDGHKMYGPKGVGLLYHRRGLKLLPILHGGGQEGGLRSTTENVPSIIGFAKAFEIAVSKREKETIRLAKLRDYFFSEMENCIINGDLLERLPNNVNISVLGLDTEFAVLKLDVAGIACSTKSSCLGSEGGSYVVRALGNGSSAEERALSTLRFTFGRDTTKKDVEFLLKILRQIVSKSILVK